MTTQQEEETNQSKLKIDLEKIRAHANGNQKSVAKLLEVIESTLTQSNLTINPITYYQSIISTLKTLISKPEEEQLGQDQIKTDSIYLLSIIINYLPPNVIKAEKFKILETVRASFDSIHRSQDQDQQDQSLIRSILSIFQPVYLSFSSNDFNSIQSQSIAQPICLKFILPFILNHQPKLRKSTQSFIAQLINHPPIPLSIHPYHQQIVQFTFDQLTQSIHSTLNHPSQVAPTQQHSITIIISLINFIQSIHSKLSTDRLDQSISILLSLPKLNQPHLNSIVFNTLENFFGPNTQLEPSKILSILTAIISFDHLSHHPISSSARLNALENGWITLARLSPELCSKELQKIGRLDDLFQNFSSPNQEIRSATKKLFSSISRYTLTDQEINKAYQTFDDNDENPSTNLELILKLILVGLNSSEIIAVGGTVEVIGALKSLIIRLGQYTQASRPDNLPYATKFLKEHILSLDRLRARGIGLETVIDETLGSISQTYGPSFLLEILPLNLNLDEEDSIQQGRAWLLTVIKVFNSSLGHFISYFVPLSDKIFEKKRDTLKLVASYKSPTDQKLKQNGLLKVKIYDTLIDQIWRLLPGYCDLPRDLETAFSRPFAELLTNVIYSQPALRPPILNSLKILIDKTLSLTKRCIIISKGQNDQNPDNTDNISTKNEFGFDPHAHLNHLKSFASNFLAVLFNVYNSSYKPSSSSSGNEKTAHDPKNLNANRGYMVDCMRSLLEIISDKELSESYEKVKNILIQSISTKSQTTNVTTQKMLDLLIVLLPRLVSSSSIDQPARIREVQKLVCQDVVLLGTDFNVQKKSFKLLTTFIELIYQQGKVAAIDDINGLIEKLISPETTAKISGPAKRERALLVSGVIHIIPPDQLHLIPKLLTEVILGCKESNSEVRTVSYDGLINIAKKIKQNGGKINWNSLMGDEDGDQMKDVEQEASVEEYLKMISAGLAAASPHMVSATVAALSRVVFEFHNDLSQSTIDELISTIEIFLNSPNREIAKTAIGFMKVVVISLPKEIVIGQLEKIVPGLLKWANEHKNHFKSNIQQLLDRLLRKFGFEVIEKFVVNRPENDGGRKLVYSLKKNQKKKKNQKQREEKQITNDGADDDHDDDGKKPYRARLGDAYEEALYGSCSSDSDGEDEDDRGTNKQKGQQKGKKQKSKASVQQEFDNNLLEDDEDQVMDLLDGGRMSNRAMAGKLAKAEKRKEELKKIASGYQKDSGTGKMIIEERDGDDDDQDEGKKKQANEMSSTNAFLEAINGEDGFKRDSRGQIKFNKKRKQPMAQDDDDGQELIEEGVKGLSFRSGALDGETRTNKQKKVKRVKEKLGSEFKAKKAGGDRVGGSSKGGVQPFAYLPLSDLNSKKKSREVSTRVNITGKTKGSR